jgi:glycosyltransferase involved in cell wall biosynthesis
MKNDCELTVLMPCLNEAETLARCIKKAQAFLKRSRVAGEVLIADNGSTDGSQAIAGSLGARVVCAPVRGYGAALIEGIEVSIAWRFCGWTSRHRVSGSTRTHTRGSAACLVWSLLDRA